MDLLARWALCSCIIKGKKYTSLYEQSFWVILMFKYVLHLLQSLDAPSLQNVSLALTSNQLLAVIGPVGAGKVRYLLMSSFQSRRAVVENWFDVIVPHVSSCPLCVPACPSSPPC